MVLALPVQATSESCFLVDVTALDVTALDQRKISIVRFTCTLKAYEAVSEDPVHAVISNDLGSLLDSRFEHMGSMEDVSRAIGLANAALEAHPR